MAPIKTKYFSLDILKGVAILGVVLVHYNNLHNFPITFISDLFGFFGSSCPLLFYVISAFLLFKTAYLYDISSSYKIKEFYTKKSRRIIPMYFLSLILYIILNNDHHSINSIIAHFTLTNAFFPYYINDIQGVEWYISNLFIFILLMPIFYRYLTDLKKTVIAFVVFSIFEIVASILFYINIEYLNDEYDLMVYVNAFCFILHFPGMMLGVILFFLIRDYNKSKKTYAYTTFISAIICVILYSFKSYIGIILLKYIVWSYIVLSSLMYDTAIIKNHSSIFKIFIALGKYSLSIYLLHMLIITYFEKLDLDYSNIPIWCIIYFLICATSMVLGRYCENFIKMILGK